MKKDMVAKDAVSFRDVYELVDDRTTRIESRVQHLSDRFDKMEAGRLTILEGKFNELKSRQTINSAKGAIVWGLVITGLNFMLSLLLILITRKI